MITLLTLGTFTLKCLGNAGAPYEILKIVQLKSSAHLENSEVRLACAHAILCKLDLKYEKYYDVIFDPFQ